jgi:hypothetical protein
MVKYSIKFNSCDSRSHERALNQFIEMRTNAKDFFSNVGADVSDNPDGTYEISISRSDGRGLLKSVRAFCAQSVYYELRG